jgi:hypothetical protein
MISETKNTRISSDIDRLMKVLADQRRALVAARCDEKLLNQYGALIRFLRVATAEELRRIFPAQVRSHKSSAPEEPELSEVALANMPGTEIERIINDESTPRKFLERIAIYRFQVPRGSMRRFSNREMLVSKLSTLLRNEQAHSAIEAVARGQAKLPGIRSKSKVKAEQAQ